MTDTTHHSGQSLNQMDASDFTHNHVYLSDNQENNERKVWWVIALTASMMIVEIAAGHWYGSMALVADGWHMSTHAGAMLIAALAYRYARKNANNPEFSFGTGKVGDLAGFASAVVLLLIALLIGWESVLRFIDPVTISFEQAIAVAVVGLAVNLASAWLLRDDHHHHHGAHIHDHHEHGQDNNLRAAYLHVLADAVTSVLAIVALLLGRAYGWSWADPAMGIVGALVISRWACRLIQDAGGVLLDRLSDAENLERAVRGAIETSTDSITDLHIWQVGPGHYSVIAAITSSAPKATSEYKILLRQIDHVSHTTVEVHQAPASD